MINSENLYQLWQYLHQNPELSFKEHHTTQFIARTLKNWGITFKRFKKLETGGYADVGSGGPVFAYRAEIDALPIEENPAHSVSSRNRGVMHACGHDYHTTIGLGLLKYFSENPRKTGGKLRVIFQPGEEAAPGGAEKVLAEDIWQGVKGILTVHTQPQIPTGTFLLFKGPVQASSTSVKILLKGPGGHTSRPFESVDLINVAGQYITQLQAYVKQKTDVRDTVAFAFGSINGGETHNIIPDKIFLWGTLRTLDNEVLARILKHIQHFSGSFAKLFDIQIEVQFPTNCPAVINDANLVRKFHDFMQKQNLEQQIQMPEKPSMGSDDFSFYLKKAPGLYLVLGGGGKGALHSPDLEMDQALIDSALEVLTGFISYLFKETSIETKKKL